MVRYLQHNDIDKKKWDECIDNSLNSLIYAKSWYLDIVCPHWDCIEIDNYKAVFPLPVKKKYNIRYIYPPYFVQQLGLFFCDEKYNQESIIIECINKIPEKFRFIELYLNDHNKLSSNLYPVSIRKNFLLNLNDNYKNIFQKYSHGLKGKLKVKSAENIVFANNGNPDELILLYKENTGLTKLKNDDFSKLKKIISEGSENKSVELRMAYCENVLIAGGVFLIYKNRIIYLFSSSSLRGRKLQAMSFLLDNLIREYSQQPYIFDFEGSMVEGIAKFFKSFGSTESVYLQLKINRLPRFIRWLKE